MSGCFGADGKWYGPTKTLSKYAFLINEDKNPPCKHLDEDMQNNFLEKLIEMEPIKPESQVTRMAKLLADKIAIHSGEFAERFGPDEILASSSITLAPVLYRIAAESFVRHSNATFKIIECRDVTKLCSDWNPSLPDFLISLGHQVIVVDLKDEHSAYYGDFAYAIIRQLDHTWKERLPRSFFYPDDVCSVLKLPECHLTIITPVLPDGELEFANVKSKLEQNLLSMLKNSCLTALQNHLLLRDLRIGKLSDAMDGIECIRRIYRELQRRIKSGEKVFLGSASEELKLYMTTEAGLTISSAESILSACKIMDAEETPECPTSASAESADDTDEPLVEIKRPVTAQAWTNQQQLSRQSSETGLNQIEVNGVEKTSDEKTSADGKTSADETPSVDGKSPGVEKTGADKKSSTDEKTSADEETSGDEKTSADETASVEAETSGDETTGADKKSSADEKTGAHKKSSADEKTGADKKYSADEKTGADGSETDAGGSGESG